LGWARQTAGALPLRIVIQIRKIAFVSAYYVVQDGGVLADSNLAERCGVKDVGWPSRTVCPSSDEMSYDETSYET